MSYCMEDTCFFLLPSEAFIKHNRACDPKEDFNCKFPNMGPVKLNIHVKNLVAQQLRHIPPNIS